MISVSKSYDKNHILHDVDINIEKGEFVAVVGPSGCGKSTLLRLVAGLDTVSSGSILINNTCVNKIPPASRDMAMVFQTYALYPHMTAYDNIAYGLKMRGIKKTIISQKVKSVARMLQLEDYLHRKPSMLSGGQRQRVAMGRAIVRSPAVFLFDEPLSNLDAKLRTEMRHEIKKLHQALNTTCLYVTHDHTEAMTLADRLVVLNKGRVEQIGTPRELYQYPATLFVASFIGHYSMNLLPANIDLKQQAIMANTGCSLPLPTLECQVACGDSVMIGIRPEHLNVIKQPSDTSISGKIEFVDDMGADKLIQIITDSGIPLSVRVSGDTLLNTDKLVVEIDMKKATLFCKQTGKRLGGWDE
jgi:sn-glycerol 3-phosphate transport system ATP-binding protein